MQSAKVSIVTPSLNQGEFLGAMIRSVSQQSYQNRELIVIDGGSTDKTVEILKRSGKDVGYWISEPDRGQSQAFNRGLSVAQGTIIGWLNADDLYLGNCLAEAVAYFEEHDDIDIVFSDYVFIDAHSRFVGRRKEIPFSLPVYVWTGRCYHANCAGFFRRRVFERAGGLDESLHYAMDQDFYIRAALAGSRFGHIRAYWGAYRLHDLSKSVRAAAVQREESEAIARRYCPIPPEHMGARLLGHLWGSLRVARKVLLGSYLPDPAHLRENRAD